MTPFGRMGDGRAIHAVEIGAGDLTARVLTKGAILHQVRLAGVDRNLTLASDDPDAYDGPLRYFGAIVAPVANRITGARAVIDGAEVRLDANEGPNSLHSGPSGTWNKLWTLTRHGPDHVTLTIDLPDGAGGFPGNRSVTVTFCAVPPATLRMEITATTDAPTLMNVANHSYWNLDGTPTWDGHVLRIAADRYTPVDAATLPTGEAAPVEGTGFDFRRPRPLVAGHPALDHNFCLSDSRTDLRDVLWLTGGSGLRMTLATTEPGVQVYDGSFTTGPGGALRQGLAIEPQLWPDAPTHPGFPSILLRPGQTYAQTTEWRFDRT